MTSTVRVGIIGYGYWGPNLVRNFLEIKGVQVVSVCDAREERLALVQQRYPSIHVTRDAGDLLGDHQIDAVAIATPISSHFKLASRALECGKHVLVEKPLACSSEECIRLIELARQRQRTLMVGHTFVFNPAVLKMKEILDSGEIGQMYYFDSVRTNLGLFQADFNVIWDLAPHDLSIVLFLYGCLPKAVSAIGSPHVNRMEDIAYINLLYDDNFLAHVHVNWLAPAKIRRVVLSGSQKMIVFDDMEASEKVKVYDKGVSLKEPGPDPYQMLVQYRMGSMYSPHIENVEALKAECQHFLDCITRGVESLASGERGLEVVRLLEAADRSMRQSGAMQAIPRSLS